MTNSDTGEVPRLFNSMYVDSSICDIFSHIRNITFVNEQVVTADAIICRVTHKSAIILTT